MGDTAERSVSRDSVEKECPSIELFEEHSRKINFLRNIFRKVSRRGRILSFRSLGTKPLPPAVAGPRQILHATITAVSKIEPQIDDQQCPQAPVTDASTNNLFSKIKPCTDEVCKGSLPPALEYDRLSRKQEPESSEETTRTGSSTQEKAAEGTGSKVVSKEHSEAESASRRSSASQLLEKECPQTGDKIHALLSTPDSVEDQNTTQKHEIVLKDVSSPLSVLPRKDVGATMRPFLPASQSSSGPSQRPMPDFRELNPSLFEATRLQPRDALRSQWSEAWRIMINKRLMDLHLGPNIITNLRFCMMGSSPDPVKMKPTILLICPDMTKKVIEQKLTGFIKITVPPEVEFRIVIGKIKPSSGDKPGPYGLPFYLGGRLELDAFINQDSLTSMVGCQVRVRPEEPITGLYPTCTIGGVISIGNVMFALTVAHALFGVPTEPGLELPKKCGFVHSYEWSGNGSSEHAVPESDSSSAMDWMLIRLSSEFQLPNVVSRAGKASMTITGSLNVKDFEDSEVVICAGVSGTQLGFLSYTTSTITFGSVNYDVFHVALEQPIAEGDSGSWVIKDGKVLGCIFARLEDLYGAYMLPIEPILDRIASSPAAVNKTVRIAGTESLEQGKERAVETVTEVRASASFEDTLDSAGRNKRPVALRSVSAQQTTQIADEHTKAMSASATALAQKKKSVTHISNFSRFRTKVRNIGSTHLSRRRFKMNRRQDPAVEIVKVPFLETSPGLSSYGYGDLGGKVLPGETRLMFASTNRV